jgi:hypothetical protein
MQSRRLSSQGRTGRPPAAKRKNSRFDVMPVTPEMLLSFDHAA